MRLRMNLAQHAQRLVELVSSIIRKYAAGIFMISTFEKYASSH